MKNVYVAGWQAASAYHTARLQTRRKPIPGG
jgi:hypothetical protein